MARPLRLQFAGALYHITSRGDRQESIYESDRDRTRFLLTLGEVCESYNWVCHAYCLMSNHYHLLIETPDGNLSQGMRHVNGVYTQYFNRNHRRVGHVFQGRYKSILVEKEGYLRELARYIVLNPVRAQMVPAAQHWPWSSYRATAGMSPCPNWLHVDWLLSTFSHQRKAAIKAYKRFVDDGADQPSIWQRLVNQVYLGSEAFVDAMLTNIDGERDLSEVPSCQRRALPKSLDEYGLASKSRDHAIVRAYASGSYSMKEIGEHFGLHYSRVSRILRKAKGKT